MLQIRDDDEADNDKQKPRSNLSRRDHIPFVGLIGIFPGAEVRRDVFGNPDEKSDQRKADIERYPAPLSFDDSEIYSCVPEEGKYEDNQYPSNVGDECVGEEIDINRDAENDAPQMMSIASELDV